MSDEPNEILEAAAAAKAHQDAAAKAEKDAKSSHWEIGKIGLGVGIGSAAVAAAVLYAARNRKK